MLYNFEELMNKTKEYIEKIIVKQGYDDVQADEFIESCNLQFLLTDLLKVKKNKLKAIYYMLLQEKMGQIMREEVQKLAKLTQQQNIKVILLKGILLADKYYPNEKLRMTEDLDLFVSIEDLSKFMMICKNEGYKFYDGGEITIQRIEKYKTMSEIEKYHHIDPIVKPFKFSVLSVDVHISFFLFHWFGEKCQYISRDFYKRSIALQGQVYKNLFGLELHDLLIYQQMHFIQHLYKNIWEGFCTGFFYVQKKVNLLFELAIIISQESNNISWDYYCKLCLKYEIAIEVAIVLEYINQIFGSIVPKNVISNLIVYSNHYHKPLFYDYVCRYDFNKKFQELLIRDATEQVKELVQNVFLKKEKHSCASSKKKAVCFEINHLSNNNNFSIRGSKLVAKQMQADIWLNWNKKYLYICVAARYNNRIMFNSSSEYQEKTKDSVAIILFDYKHELNANHVRVNFLGEITYKSPCYQDSFVKSELKNNMLHVYINWKTLNIKAEVGSSFGFNFEWDHFDEATKLYTTLSLSGNPSWHDVVGMKKIELVQLCSNNNE